MRRSDALARTVPQDAAYVDPDFWDILYFMAHDEAPFGVAGHIFLRVRFSRDFRNDFLAFVRMVILKGGSVSRPAFELFHQLSAGESNLISVPHTHSS